MNALNTIVLAPAITEEITLQLHVYMYIHINHFNTNTKYMQYCLHKLVMMCKTTSLKLCQFIKHKYEYVY